MIAGGGSKEFLAKMKEELMTASTELAKIELENSMLEEVLGRKTQKDLAKTMRRLEEARRRNSSLKQKLEQDHDKGQSSKKEEVVSVTDTYIHAFSQL